MDKHIFKLFDLTFDNNNIFKWKFIMMQREKNVLTIQCISDRKWKRDTAAE